MTVSVNATSRRAPLIGTREEPRADTSAPAPVPSPLAALADPRLRHARSDVLRATLARQAQALIGNHAVANVLARAAPVAPPAAEHLTGEAVDALLAAHPLFSTYITPKADAGRLVAGHVHHHPYDEFLTRYVAYAIGKENPDTGKPYTEKEAKAEAGMVNGFFDTAKDEIHINLDRADPVTYLHEGIHYYAHATWMANTGFNVNEGITELLTRELRDATGTPGGSGYPKQFAAASKLVDAVGLELVAAAYFNGDVLALASKLEQLHPENRDRFDDWVKAVDAGRYAEAAALIPAK